MGDPFDIRTLPQFYDDRGNSHPCHGGRTCQLEQARQLFASAQALLDQSQRLAGRTTEGKIMSQAMWCDAGEHPFSARDPKAERWDRTMKDADGNTVTLPWDVCGPCLEGAVPGFNLKQRHAIMEGKMPGLDPEAS